MLKILLFVALLRSPTWVIIALVVGCALLWVLRAIGTRNALLTLAFGVTLGGLALFKLGIIGGRGMLGVLAVCLSLAALADRTPEGRAEREAAARAKKAEAQRVGPIKTPSSSTALVLGGLFLLVALPVAGAMLGDYFGLAKGYGFTTGLALGFAACAGAVASAAIRERDHRRSVPAGVIGQTGEGVYVYDLDALKRAQGADGMRRALHDRSSAWLGAAILGWIILLVAIAAISQLSSKPSPAVPPGAASSVETRGTGPVAPAPSVGGAKPRAFDDLIPAQNSANSVAPTPGRLY
jgi:hypothetical protein